jgi:C1A family cysteine protease
MPDEPIDPTNIEEMQRLVGEAGHSWRVREPMFSEREFQARLGVLPEPSPTEPEIVARTEAMLREAPHARDLRYLEQVLELQPIWPFLVPAVWDWRDHGIIGDVTDQENCGSCVSFAVAGLVTSMAAKEHGTHNLRLSEAELHFCSSHGATCGGWWPDQALQVVKDEGVVVESAFDYDSAFDTPRQFDADNLWVPHCRGVGDRTYDTWKISDFSVVDDVPNLPLRKAYLHNTGPMVASFDVYWDFNSYGGGVYKHTWGDYRGGHCVLVVGYDDDDSSWICRNSWGAGFGGSAQADGTGGGYFKIGYGECKFDDNHMYGATGTQPPPLRWIVDITKYLLYRARLNPGDPIERILDLRKEELQRIERR